LKRTPYFQKYFLLLLTFIIIVSTVIGCTHNESFEDFTHSLFLQEVTSNTMNLHYTLENPHAYGISMYNVSLGDFSSEARSKTASDLKKTLNTLTSYPYLTLTVEDKLTYDVLEDYLNTQLSLADYPLYQEPLSGSGGLQTELPILFAEYKFNSEQDVKDYLKLISLTDEYFIDIIDFEKEKAAAGFFMSDNICQTVIESCESFLANPENHYLLTTFENRLSQLDLSEKKAKIYKNKNRQLLQQQLFPAYQTLISELETLKGSGKNNLGLCNFPGGSDYYALLCYSYTGCDDTIDQIFRKIEVQRMQDLIASANIQNTDSTIINQCTYLEWEMPDAVSMLNHLKKEILPNFPTPPDSYCEINCVDPALEQYLAPAFYIVAPIDNYLDNCIYINNSYVTNDLYGFTTMAHEGYPGHLYQTVMSYEYELPEIRSILNYPGYAEGWATYTEMMSYDYAGLDENVSAFLSLNQAATLSLYASSDIGLHYYGWSEDDMYAFWSGFGITDMDTIDEITQLILSEPGNYLKYYVGYLEFLSLQDYARSLLGENFSLKEFHRTVLDIGPAPFSIIEKYFLEYYSPQT